MDDCACPCHLAHPAQPCTMCLVDDEFDGDEPDTRDAERKLRTAR